MKRIPTLSNNFLRHSTVETVPLGLNNVFPESAPHLDMSRNHQKCFHATLPGKHILKKESQVTLSLFKGGGPQLMRWCKRRFLLLLSNKLFLLVLKTKSWARQSYEIIKTPKHCYKATWVPVASYIMQNTFFSHDDEKYFAKAQSLMTSNRFPICGLSPFLFFLSLPPTHTKLSITFSFLHVAISQ